jgi:hypothetical protein
MKYYILYIVDSSQQVRVVKTKKQADDFVQEFMSKYKGQDGWWIEHVFYGKKLMISEKYQLGN